MTPFTLWKDLTQSAKVVVAVALLLAALSVVRSCGQQTSLDKYRVAYRVYQDSVRLVLQRSDSLRIVAQVQHAAYVADSLRADSLTHRIAVINTANQQLHQQNDSLAQLVLSDTTLSPQVRQVIVGLQTENDSLRVQIGLDAQRDTQRVKAIVSLTSEVQTERKRANDLAGQLAALPAAPKSDHLFGLSFLPHLTPTETFFVGAAVGAVVSSKL